MENNMNYDFEILGITRNNLLNAVKDLSMKDLHTIPKGFNNHIAWNFNHCVIVQQLLCYKLSGLEIDLDSELIKRYSKGSAPTEEILEADIELCKVLLVKNIHKIKEDYEKGIFKTYKEYSTSYNITLKCVEDAIRFNNVHEGLHFGYIMALKRALEI
ncbi:MAG: DinB family protein [Chitinophagales bacterium]